MKRFFCLCLILVLLAVTASAAEFGTMLDLWNHWSMNGMPDWVCGVSSTDGSMENLTVIVNTPEDEQRLRELLEDTSTLTVVVSETAWTEKDLQKVNQEIASNYMGSGSPVKGVGIGWAIVDGVLTGFGESGKESRVVVDVLQTHADEYRHLFAEQYGDLVYVQGIEDYAMPVLEEAAPEEAALHRHGWMAVAAVVLAVIGAACLLFIQRKKRQNDK